MFLVSIYYKGNCKFFFIFINNDTDFISVVGRRNPHSNNSSANFTSDFDEEFSDADEDKQIIEIDININGVELKNINLLVTKHGVAKILNDTKNSEHAKLRRYVYSWYLDDVPLIFN